MPVLIIIVGVQGSGKSTLLKNIRKESLGKVCKPSTTRPPRFDGEDEYYFYSEENWPSSELLWEIEVKGNKYGYERGEIQNSSPGVTSFAVFDPGNIEILYQKRSSLPFEIVTVGIDTLEDPEQQKQRVREFSQRVTEENDFFNQLGKVRESDIVIKGSSDQIFRAISSLSNLLNSRGGIVPKNILYNFIECGSVLQNADPSSLSTASFDLRLGEEAWCQGNYFYLNDQNPFLEIPPYSYAIVKAKETAKLPNFMAGKFDLKVSLFFKGGILSNGPQVDPGYHGALFCMIYNGSDEPIGLKKDAQFSTIEFFTTTSVTDGYFSKHQDKTSLKDFIPPDKAVGSGGIILERWQNEFDRIKEEWDDKKGQIDEFINRLFVIISIIFASVVGLASILFLLLLAVIKEIS